MLFAKSEIAPSSIPSDAFEILHALPTADFKGYEPFGFKDGISQPEVDWEQSLDLSRAPDDYRHRAALGEFVLGYKNEYGRYTDRPLLDPALDIASDLPRAENDSDRKDFGRDGSYLVLRQLEQNVAGFHSYLDRASGGDAAKRENLGACMVGRYGDGRPLIPATDENNFVYDADPGGLQCPLGAHVRRANPRGPDMPGLKQGPIKRVLQQLGIPRPDLRDDLISSTRFHRILRRGREYRMPDGSEGIYFACLNANIERQFEFVQSAWLMSEKFNGMTEESDPLLGNHGNASRFSIPQPGGLAHNFTGLQQFVTVKGGAYFFMPGLGALRFLTREREGL